MTSGDLQGKSLCFKQKLKLLSQRDSVMFITKHEPVHMRSIAVPAPVFLALDTSASSEGSRGLCPKA